VLEKAGLSFWTARLFCPARLVCFPRWPVYKYYLLVELSAIFYFGRRQEKSFLARF
jgi:hypothetical protein